jgi:Tfp pilus assembly protein PilV
MGVMHGIPSRPYPSRRARTWRADAARLVREDDGFGLIEVMVSAVLVVALALGTLKLLDGAQQVSANNRSRDIAAQLAQSEQDKIRQMPIAELAGGYHASAPVSVGALTYNVTTDAEWVTDTGGAVTCSTSANVAYLATSTSVTWPGMGKIKPVTADAIVDPGVAAVGAKKGALTVVLSRADGTGAGGVTVNVGGMSAVTDDNGCAVIGNIDPGPQTLSYADPNFVDKDSKQSVSKPVTIGAGTIAQATGSYDNPGYITLTTPVDASTNTPDVWDGKYSIDHDSRTTPTLFTVQGDTSQNGTPIKVGLYPFPSAYRWYAGGCAGNNPSKYGGANQGDKFARGDNKSSVVDLPTTTVTVDYTNVGTLGNAAMLVFEPEPTVAAMNGCPGKAISVTPPPANSSAKSKDFKVQLPYGAYRVCAYYRYSGNSLRWGVKPTSSTFGALDTPLVVTPPSITGTYQPRLNTKITFNAQAGTTFLGSSGNPDPANC